MKFNIITIFPELIDNFINHGLISKALAKNIKSGTRIIRYKGKIISNKQVEENPKFDNSKDIYLFDLNKRFSLDGDFSWNTARLIIHAWL